MSSINMFARVMVLLLLIVSGGVMWRGFITDDKALFGIGWKLCGCGAILCLLFACGAR